MASLSAAFAADLYAQLARKDGNFFFSPFSVQTALAMAWAGARGKTAEEMAKTLRLEATDSSSAAAHDQVGSLVDQLNADGKKGGYELAVANALWGQKGYPFLPEYLTLVTDKYGGNLSELDFVHDSEGSRVTINDWVANKTHDRIKDLLAQGVVNAMTRLILTNAIYFKGKWDCPFKKHMTKEDDFTLLSGKKSKVQLMHQKEKFRYTEDSSTQVLELTYGRNDLAMRVFLPRNIDGLESFESGLTPEKLEGLAKGLRREEVQVWLPQFTMESEFALSEVLKHMGMKLAFVGGEADFSGMTTAESFFVSDVIHKAFVKVDEEGTEAAAATAVTMRAMACRIQPVVPKVFRADHPFLFQIVHQRSGSILFLGRVAAP